jgi:hypothetical protein
MSGGKRNWVGHSSEMSLDHRRASVGRANSAAALESQQLMSHFRASV